MFLLQAIGHTTLRMPVPCLTREHNICLINDLWSIYCWSSGTEPWTRENNSHFTDFIYKSKYLSQNRWRIEVYNRTNDTDLMYNANFKTSVRYAIDLFHSSVGW